MDSDNENEEFHPWRGVPGTIVLINAYNPSKTDTPSVSHAATCSMIKQHLRQSNTHYIAVCLYGTESETTGFGLHNVTEVCALNLPNLEDYKKLQSAKISSFGQAKELKLSDPLWHCSKMFANCKKQMLSRTILILTRLDIPPVESDHRATYIRVADLVETNIDVKLINIAEKDYPVHPFYENFLINCGKDAGIPKPIWDCNKIVNVMYQQSHRHLAVAQLTFELGNGFDVGVGVYRLLKSGYQQKHVNLERDTNAIVTSVNKTLKVSKEEPDANGISMDVDEENQEMQLPILKSELLYYQEYGGERVEFTDKEKKMMNNPFGPPMLKLLGFKPARIMCKEKWYLKAGYFLFPSENIIEGSTCAFKALHKACIDTSVVAICVLCTRVNSKPIIVALSPCSHPLGLDVEIGFDVILIPFMENVRQISVEEVDVDISMAHKSTMKDIINKLVFNYKADMFENPKQQSQYRAIETIALGDEDVEPFIDTTKPDPDKFKSLQDDLFEEIFGPFGATVSKRAAPREYSSTTKKTKVETETEIDEDLLRNRLSTNKVNSYMVSQLRQILRSKHIPNLPALTGLKKNELVNLVYEHFG